MQHAHPVAAVRAAEQALMATLPPGALMRRAAVGLAVRCADLLGRVAGTRVVLLVGAGDNGGDTLHAGALLARRGARVVAVLLSPDRAHPGGLAALRRAGGRVCPEGRSLTEVVTADLVLDGVVGIGGQPGLRPAAQRLAEAAHDSRALVVAVDLPSGLDVDSGATPAPHVRADATVTFGTRKACHLVDPAAAACGRVSLVDIGLGPWLGEPSLQALEPPDVARLLPVPGRQADKYRRGVLGVHVGDPAYAGAAVLAAGAATRGGVGMVRLQGEQAVTALVRSSCPEAVLAPGRVQAWLAGPGMTAQQAGPAVAAVLAAGLPAVLDAGALEALPARLDAPVLLTPHAGELARMLGWPRERVEADRLAAASAAARRWGATVLLKGSTTVVADPAGPVRVNPTGTPWLATAGSGDVLAGLAAALLAGGLSPLDAGSVAAYLHGLAGRLAAERVGAPNAQDVLAAVPSALLAARLAESLP